MPTPEASEEIRWAGPDDWPALATLLAEIRDHYRDEPFTRNGIEVMARDWLEPKPGHGRFALALDGKTPLGLAFVAVVQPVSGPGGALYMKELFVTDARRGAGTGSRLLAFLADYCVAEGLERIDFTTEDWNEGALRFYEREGATIQRQKIALRFGTESLRKLAGTHRRG